MAARGWCASIGPTPVQVHPLVERLAAYAWRLLAIAAALVAILWLIGRTWVVFLPLVIAILITRVLAWPADRLRDRGWRPTLVAAVTLVGFLVALATTLTLLGIAVGEQAKEVGPTISEAIDDVEEWLVEEAPFDVSRADIERFRDDLGQSVREGARTSSGAIVDGAVVFFEIVVSIVLGLIITFFTIKDGNRFARWAQRQLPVGRRELAERLATRAWGAIGGYLRGAATLGLVEGIVIGAAVAIFGGQLAVPVGVFTFLMAFVPILGAIVAGAMAVLVTLATGGGSAALLVLVVVVVVQQLDNDLLAPVVYGRSLELHPVAVLLSVVAGGALFGLPGTFLAVPVTAVVVGMLTEWRRSLDVGRDRAAPAVD
jgi:predicted PurR-regulated permease PerM